MSRLPIGSIRSNGSLHANGTRRSGPRGVPAAALGIVAALAASTAVLAGSISAPALAGTAPTAPAGPVAHSGATPPASAAAYLVSQLTDGNHFERDGQPNYGITVDIALGLAAAGTEPTTVAAIAAYLDTPESVAAYTHGVPYDGPTAVYAGPTAKLALTAMVTGLDPTSFGGEDLLANLAKLEAPSGRFSDVSDFGDFSNVLGQSFAVLAQTAASGVQPDDAAVAFLMSAACDDGGFPIDFPAKGTCETSPDASGIAVQALDAADPDEGPEDLGPDREASLIAAVRSLEATRSPDGWWEAFDAPSVNSTGYAAMGLLAVGQTAQTSIDWLASIQHADGGLPLAIDDPDSDAFATAQALEALAGTSFLTLDPALLHAVIAVPPSNTSPTATPTETATPTSTASTSASPTIAPTLPQTGAGKTGKLLGAALLLLVLGVALVVASRRLKSRP